MKTKLLESKYQATDVPYTMIFNLEYFIKNGSQIINDCGCYGGIVLLDTSELKCYGLLFKDQGSAGDDVEVKCYLYSWPQNGALKYGKTFWCRVGEIADCVLRTIPQVG